MTNNKLQKAKDAKKQTKREDLQGVLVEQNLGDYSFAEHYGKWKQQMQSLKMAKIGITGNNSVKSKTLFDFMKHHVTVEARRPNSPNDGKSGCYIVINALEKLIQDYASIADQEDIDILETWDDYLNQMKSHNSLNPANITFKVPTGFAEGKPVYPKKPNQFGHYRSEAYNDLVRWKNKNNKGKKQRVIAAQDSWTSANRDFSARPPMYLAIWGGDMVDVGLHDIIKEAIEALTTKTTTNVILTQLRKPGILATEHFSELKPFLAGLLKNKMYFNSETGELNGNAMARGLATNKFRASNMTDNDGNLTEKGKRLYTAARGKPLDDDKEPVGKLLTYQIKVSGSVLIQLIQAIFGRRLGGMRGAYGHYIHGGAMDWRKRVDGKPVNHPKDIKKSWQDILKVGEYTLGEDFYAEDLDKAKQTRAQYGRNIIMQMGGTNISQVETSKNHIVTYFEVNGKKERWETSASYLQGRDKKNIKSEIKRIFQSNRPRRRGQGSFTLGD